MEIRGVARVDGRTKDLVRRLRAHEIAVINHQDIDEAAADALIRGRVQAVVNAAPSISGRYPNPGPKLLMEAGVPVIDLEDPRQWESFHDGDLVELRGQDLYVRGRPVGPARVLSLDDVIGRMESARKNLSDELDRFFVNTLHFAADEKELVLGTLPLPPMRTSFKGRHALIVVRGKNYRADLKAVRAYVRERRPVLVGVDGGADALLEANLRPDVIVGDMDSVSDQALRSGAELLVHAYRNGKAPGLDRVRELSLVATVVPAVGTSEDVAMLVAYEQGAELIVAVGAHSSLVDFLEKNRPGMASTLLTRMKVGSLLVDARGVSQLYPGEIHARHLLGILLAALTTGIIVLLAAPFTRTLLQIIVLKFRVAMGL